MRRVVVTGMGLVTPLGVGLDHNWRRLTNGESGAASIQRFDVSDLPAKIAAQVPLGSGEDGTFNPDNYVSSKEQRRIDEFIVYGISAAVEAVEEPAAVLRLASAALAARTLARAERSTVTWSIL